MNIGSSKGSILEELVALEDVTGINLGEDIVEAGVVAVGDDGLTLGFELCEVVDNLTAEEGCAVLKGGFVDDDLGTLGLDALHDALDGGLTEVVGVGFHGKPIDSYGRGS